MAWWSIAVGPIMGIVDKVLDRTIPDRNARAKAKELLEQSKADFEQEFGMALMEISKGQLEINKVEAAHKSPFVAGWRPAIGWVCALGLMWTFVVSPFGQWACAIWKPEVLPLPELDSGQIMTLVMSMLGMGGLRSWEKMKGVAREK